MTNIYNNGFQPTPNYLLMYNGDYFSYTKHTLLLHTTPRGAHLMRIHFKPIHTLINSITILTCQNSLLLLLPHPKNLVRIHHHHQILLPCSPLPCSFDHGGVNNDVLQVVHPPFQYHEQSSHCIVLPVFFPRLGIHG